MANFQYRKNMNGSNATPATMIVPIGDSQTLVVGDAVVLSSGKAVKAGNGTGRVLGIMAEDVTTGAGSTSTAKIEVVTPSQVWEATASADATTYVLGGRAFDLTSAQLVNVADTTGGSLQILELNDSTTNIFVQFTACDLA
jgi:hypothetical protein